MIGSCMETGFSLLILFWRPGREMLFALGTICWQRVWQLYVVSPQISIHHSFYWQRNLPNIGNSKHFSNRPVIMFMACEARDQKENIRLRKTDMLDWSEQVERDVLNLIDRPYFMSPLPTRLSSEVLWEMEILEVQSCLSSESLTVL